MPYSLHLGSNKNNKNSSRFNSKNNLSKSTSYANNGIQNSRQLSKVSNHDFRKYDKYTKDIYTIKGTNNAFLDVKDFYKSYFEESRLEYNSKQNRPSRMINDYFEHVSNDDKRDLACEIIIELGNKEYWEDKEKYDKKKMVPVFQEQVKELERIVPNFKITNAVVHLDEHSPHLHILGVPIKSNCKTGLKTQVGKSDVFTKESLIRIQDHMRNECIKSFNKVYGIHATLKKKEKGRNKDINVRDMYNYQELKKELEIKKNSIDKNNEKIKSINNSSKELKEIVSELKGNDIIGYRLTGKQKERLEALLKDVKDISDYFDNYKNIIDSLSSINDNLEYHKNKNYELEKTKNKLIKDSNDLKENLQDQSDSVELLKQILNGRKEQHLELITYLAQNVNSNDYQKSNIFKRISNDLKNKRIINNNEHRVISKPMFGISKYEIERALKHINQEMEEASEKFYNNDKSDYEL